MPSSECRRPRALYQNKIYLDREDGFEAFVYPQHLHGVTIELIEPYASSRGYRFADLVEGVLHENA